MSLRFDVVTLFPELFSSFLDAGLVARARRAGLLDVRFASPREFGRGRHFSVDDTPYGGGSGMVMAAPPIVDALEWLDAATPELPKAHRILLTPQGQPLAQPLVRRLARHDALALVCGRYEGFDERVRRYVDEEVSLGDFVLMGGEVAAMAVIEAVSRLREGVLGNADSAVEESHSQGLLEFPQYTRPPEFRGEVVPDVLLSGDHKKIRAWREAESLSRTRTRRPDLLEKP